jgi:hypothetical protein
MGAQLMQSSTPLIALQSARRQRIGPVAPTDGVRTPSINRRL